MQIPSRITLVRSSFWLDGGSITLYGVTDLGEQCRIHLMQRCFPCDGAGRLLFNGECVEIRSDEEARIVALLRSASIELKEDQRAPSSEPPISKDALILSEDIKEFLERTPEQNLQKFRDDIVSFVESAEYVAIATKGPPNRTNSP